MEQLTPKQAAQFLKDNPKALFIDCRSQMEYHFVGHPVDALHVSWNDGFDWEINPHFVGEVKKLAGHAHDRPVVLISRNRVRSAEAGAALEANGFSRVYTVKNGFEGDLDADHHRSNINGWCHDGLPWQQC
jgi:rhodanese-related sulfurtransferase